MKGPGRIVAIIPARKGSKRLPGKNLMSFAGKPLIRWTIDVAIDSGIFDQIIITSDDEQILEEGNRPGVLNIRRPSALATDTATSIDAILHALKFLEERGESAEKFMLLQPTSPLRTAEDIFNAADTMQEKNSDSVVSVCLTGHSSRWLGRLGENQSITNFLKCGVMNDQNQASGSYYRLNGAIYYAKCLAFKTNKSFFVENSHAYIMPKERSIDIDTKLDFYLAETFLKYSLSSDESKV